MGLPQFVLRQLSCPSGWLAPFMAKALNRTNRDFNREVMSAVALQPHEHVLEIGFGGGLNIRHALEIIGDRGRVGGVEPSTEMLERARREFSRESTNGQLALREGRADALPFASDSYDAIISVHTIYFWGDINLALTEIARVLTPGGRLVLGVSEPAVCQREGMAKLFPVYEQQQLKALLEDAGFVDVELRRPREKDCYIVKAVLPTRPAHEA